LGSNWYPWQWFGFFAEGNIKYNLVVGVFPTQKDYDESNRDNRHIQAAHYSFYTKNFTVGIKTNF